MATVRGDESVGIDDCCLPARAYRGCVSGLEGAGRCAGGGCADAALFGGGAGGGDGDVVHDEVAWGGLDDVRSPETQIVALGGPFAGGGEGVVGGDGPGVEVCGGGHGDVGGIVDGCVGVIGVVDFDDGRVGEDGVGEGAVEGWGGRGGGG